MDVAGCLATRMRPRELSRARASGAFGDAERPPIFSVKGAPHRRLLTSRVDRSVGAGIEERLAHRGRTWLTPLFRAREHRASPAWPESIHREGTGLLGFVSVHVENRN